MKQERDGVAFKELGKHCVLIAGFMVDLCFRTSYVLSALSQLFAAAKNVTRVFHSLVKYLSELSLLFVRDVIPRRSPRLPQLMPKCIIDRLE